MHSPEQNRGRRRQEHAGKEFFEIQPVILGGSPTDPANKTILTRAQHIQAVRYWNKIIHEIRSGELTRAANPTGAGSGRK